jgi:hypothetical protein
MADLYSVIPGLQPTAQEILEGELLANQILEARFPDLDLREGTALRDLVIRPNAVLLALCKKAIDYYMTQRTLKGVNDVTPADMVDDILSNWFLDRNIGIRSVVNARLYFARRKNISVSSDIYFSTDNTLKFFPVESVSYNASVLSYDSYSDEFYVDIDLLAEREGVSYNIASGSLLYFSNFDPYFLRAEINYLKSTSINSETNLEFINRAKNAISTRNLINTPSIDSNLRAAFNYITHLISVGMGHEYMIRDQIKAVFNDAPIGSVDSLTSVGTLATVHLAGHGYNSGQRIAITNAVPAGYNGEYLITVLDDNSFTYVMGSSPGLVTLEPNVQAVNLPVLLHNGGMVDVYCSDSLASSIVQLTTDAQGKATLTGPVYKFKRSKVTGGSDEDTIPTEHNIPVTNVTITGGVVTVTTSAPHPFNLNDIVDMSGAVQAFTATSVTGSGVVVTVTKANHGLLAGDRVTISNATPAEYNGTFTVVSATTNTFVYNANTVVTATPATGTIKASFNFLNGIQHTITSSNPSTFTFAIRNVAMTVTGTISVIGEVEYTVKNTYTENKSISSITSNGTEVTVTMNHHGYTEGRYVTITGSSVAIYNGTWKIKKNLNKDQFTFDIPTWTNNTSVTGVVSFTIPWYDYGFSERQSLVIDFGVSYANKTASFETDFFLNLDSIQTYLDSESNRVLCADYLARGLNFYKLYVGVTSYNNTAPSTSVVSEVVDSYLKSIPVGGTFVMTDMVAKLRLNGITNIQNPPVVTYKRYNRDLSPVETGTITDVLDPLDKTNVFLLDSVATFASTS